jgi:ABC-type phosphate transport system substrate-binding protein
MRITPSFQTRLQRLILASTILGILIFTTGAHAEPEMTSADSVVVVVSVRSSVGAISKLHLADLYLGRTARFQNGAPATPIDQRSGSAMRAEFTETILNRSEAQMKAHWSKIIFTGRGRPPREVSGDAAVRDIVARDPQAIGYIDASLVDSRVRVVRVQ